MMVLTFGVGVGSICYIARALALHIARFPWEVRELVCGSPALCQQERHLPDAITLAALICTELLPPAVPIVLRCGRLSGRVVHGFHTDIKVGGREGLLNPPVRGHDIGQEREDATIKLWTKAHSTFTEL
jgi:hypothetical protein